jgi:hypothetical protein
MPGIGGSALQILRASGLLRSVLPVHVPCTVLWPTGGSTSPPLETSLQQLLTAVHRRVIYRKLVVGTQFVGLAGAWAGVLLGKGRAVTLVSVGVALVGAVLALIDKDRLSSIDSRIDRVLDEHRSACLEWLLMCLELGPYSYGNTTAAGVRKDQVLRDREALLPGQAEDALRRWLASDRTTTLPSQRWAQLQLSLNELLRVDMLGRSRERHSMVLLDTIRVLLLVLVIVIAIAIPTFTLPDTAMATLATIITLSARSATEGSLTIFTRPATSPAASSGSANSSADVLRRVASMKLSELDAGTLELVLRGAIVIPRSLIERRTIAALGCGPRSETTTSTN